MKARRLYEMQLSESSFTNFKNIDICRKMNIFTRQFMLRYLYLFSLLTTDTNCSPWFVSNKGEFSCIFPAV